MKTTVALLSDYLSDVYEMPLHVRSWKRLHDRDVMVCETDMGRFHVRGDLLCAWWREHAAAPPAQ